MVPKYCGCPIDRISEFRNWQGYFGIRKSFTIETYRENQPYMSFVLPGHRVGFWKPCVMSINGAASVRRL